MDTIGKYTVSQFLGAGGMAEVWLCRLVGIGGFEKQVVIKRILPAYAADVEFVHMFLDEARVAAGLNHPHIVQVFDIDLHEGTPYIAMEYLQGPSFSTVIKRARKTGLLSIAHGVRIVSDISAGLNYAHNAKDATGAPLGLVHRDVSPHNILVTTDGVSKLLDFGIAKSQGRLSQTQAGTFKGKLSYMAPEQANNAMLVDQRADVFSLGVCLYEATTGRLPFAADNDVQRLLQLLSGEYQKPSEVVPGFPAELERLIVWAMETDPEDRCPTALALYEALDAFSARESYSCNHVAIARWLAQLFPVGHASPLTGPGAQGLTPSRPSSVRSSPRLPPPLPPEENGAATVSALADQEVQVVDDGDVVNVTGSTRQLPSWATPSGSAPRALPADRASGSLPQSKSRRPTRTLVAGFAGAGVLGMVILLVSARTPDPAPPAVAAVVVDSDAQMRAYLAEAPHLIAERRFGMAGDLLNKAKEKPPSDPALNVELTKLLNTVECEAALDKARQLIATGEPDLAIELANKALARDPSNQEAVRILVEIRKQKEGDAKAVRPERGKKRSRNDRSATEQTAKPGFDADSLLPSNPDSLLPPGKGN